MKFNVRAAVRIFLVLCLIVISCCLSHLIDSLEVYKAILGKMALSLGARALSVFFLKMGCSGGLALAIVIVVRMAFLATEGNYMMPSGEGGRNFRWTDLFGSSSTANSEGSVNQPAPDSPNPGEPEAQVSQPLQEDEERRQELSDRLCINSLGQPFSDAEREAILEVQFETELKIERALRSDRFSEDSLISKRHQIRGLLFYPYGKPLVFNTYAKHLLYMDNYGTHHSLPYRRVLAAYIKQELELEKR